MSLITDRQSAPSIVTEVNLTFRPGFTMPSLLESLSLSVQADYKHAKPLLGNETNKEPWGDRTPSPPHRVAGSAL